MSGQPSLYTRCAENIALLEVLGKAAEPPTPNYQFESTDKLSNVRQISVRTERDLVSTLGFLAGIKDEPNNATAVCVKERATTLEVLVATNAKGPGESLHLSEVKKGFDGILENLRTAARKPRDESEKLVMRAIIAMCRHRIISRTRLGPGEQKARLQTFLEEAHQGMRQLRGIQNKPLFQRTIRELVGNMDKFCNLHPSPEQDISHLDHHLASILDGFDQLAKIENLEEILLEDLNVARPQMEFGSRRGLLNVIEKVSQYRSSATRLVTIARHHPIIRRSFITAVYLPQSAFEKLTGPRESKVTDVVARIATAHSANIDFATMCRKMKTEPSTAREHFSQAMRDITKSPKIHAEMQLINYLEAHPSQHPPRILASNKGSCFLCSAYISVHGIYTVTQSHGRISPCWRLPATGTEDTSERFVVELERLIVRRARRIIRAPIQKEVRPYESSIFSPACSLSTRLTTSDFDEGFDEGISGCESDRTLRAEDSHEMLEKNPKYSHYHSHNNNNHQHQHQPAVKQFMERPLMAAVMSAKEIIPPPPLSAPPPIPSKNVDLQWLSVKGGKTAVVSLPGQFHIHVEYDAKSGRKLRFKVQQVSQEEMAKTPEEGGRIYDVNRGLYYLLDSLCQKGCRFVKLRNKNELFRVELEAFSSETLGLV